MSKTKEKLNSSETQSLKDLWLQGRHGEVMSRALVDDGAGFLPEETPFVVASLAALGQLSDAAQLLRHQQEILSVDERVFAAVHLGVSACLQSQLELARKHLGEAARQRNSTSRHVSLFLLYYGLAFYRFGTGRLRSAWESLHRANSFLKRGDDPYFHLLSKELFAWIKGHQGDAKGAVEDYGSAVQLARQLGRDSHGRQIELQRTLCECRYLWEPREATTALTVLRQQLSQSEAYLLISIDLELARQAVRRQLVADAQSYLDSAMEIYLALGLKGPRYEMMIGLRSADIDMARGDSMGAWFRLRSLEKLLRTEGDDILALELTSRLVCVGRLLAEVPRRQNPWFSKRGFSEALVAPLVRREESLRLRTGFVLPLGAEISRKNSATGMRATELNHRQMELLATLKDQETAEVHSYRKQFKVSEITACRDLAALVRLGYLQRLGKARATRYIKVRELN